MLIEAGKGTILMKQLLKFTAVCLTVFLPIGCEHKTANNDGVLNGGDAEDAWVSDAHVDYPLPIQDWPHDQISVTKASNTLRKSYFYKFGEYLPVFVEVDYDDFDQGVYTLRAGYQSLSEFVDDMNRQSQNYAWLIPSGVVFAYHKTCESCVLNKKVKINRGRYTFCSLMREVSLQALNKRNSDCMLYGRFDQNRVYPLGVLEFEGVSENQVYEVEYTDLTEVRTIVSRFVSLLGAGFSSTGFKWSRSGPPTWRLHLIY